MSKNFGHAGGAPAQSALPGFDIAPEPTDRLFFAIFPDVDAAARITLLARHLRGEHGLTGTPLAMDRFHVTLHHLGDFVGLPRDIVVRAGEAAAAVTMPPFDISFDRAMSFRVGPTKRPLVLHGGDGVGGLTVFRRTLG
jgi:2'-5' RNA ligase